jgi:hypothetical protein
MRIAFERSSRRSEAAGAPVAIDGPMRWSLQPSLALEVSALSLHTPSLGVGTDRLLVSADLAGLFRGELRLRRLLATDVVVDLRFRPSAAVPVALPELSKLPLDRLAIETLHLQRNGEPLVALERMTFDGTARDAAVPFELTVNSTLSASARLQVDVQRGVRVHDLLLRTPAGELAGSIAVDLSAPLPIVSANLRNARLTTAVRRSDPPSTRLIPRIPLGLSVLQLLDAEIELTVDTLVISELQL